jgi:hypothetical protein
LSLRQRRRAPVRGANRMYGSLLAHHPILPTHTPSHLSHTTLYLSPPPGWATLHLFGT